MCCWSNISGAVPGESARARLLLWKADDPELPPGADRVKCESRPAADRAFRSPPCSSHRTAPADNKSAPDGAGVSAISGACLWLLCVAEPGWSRPAHFLPFQKPGRQDHLFVPAPHRGCFAGQPNRQTRYRYPVRVYNENLPCADAPFSGYEDAPQSIKLIKLRGSTSRCST